VVFVFSDKVSPFCEKKIEIFFQSQIRFLKKIAKNLSQMHRYEIVLKNV
jgi:hypothetical protein